MLLRHLVEELDDVCKVHVSVHDDVSVVLDERQRHEQVKMVGDDVRRRPNCFPDEEDLAVGELALKVEQEPPVVLRH